LDPAWAPFSKSSFHWLLHCALFTHISVDSLQLCVCVFVSLLIGYSGKERKKKDFIGFSFSFSVTANNQFYWL
jgi:hypothetical protein